jgi:hypothetical protein
VPRKVQTCREFAELEALASDDASRGDRRHPRRVAYLFALEQLPGDTRISLAAFVAGYLVRRVTP